MSRVVSETTPVLSSDSDSRPRAVARLALLAAIVWSSAIPPVVAQGGGPSVVAHESQASRPIEDLNLVGAAVTMPPFTDTVIGAASSFRESLAGHGVMVRVNVLSRFSQNLLDPPVPRGQQAYIGQRPTFVIGVNPIVTADLRQLGLRHAQLNIGIGWRYASWKPAGPDALRVTSLHVYKGWRDRRIEVKVGYVPNDLEFVGLQVGGSLATGAQGVYAVLPNEVGLSFLPFAAPSLNVKVRSSGHLYAKGAVQRSLDAGGAQATADRDPSGLTFAPHGNRVLLVGELGYSRGSGLARKQVWVRTGYMHNSTAYMNHATGREEAGNYCAYLLTDVQLRQPDRLRPAQGLFVGGTVMTVPAGMNAYHRYAEGRLYHRGPSASRPDDVLALIATYRGHSPFFTRRFEAQGRSTWPRSTAVTATYTMRAGRGDYVSLGLGFARGAALTPRVANALTATVNWSLFL